MISFENTKKKFEIEFEFMFRFRGSMDKKYCLYSTKNDHVFLIKLINRFVSMN